MNIRTALPADAAIIADFNVRMARETESRELDPKTVLAGVKALIEAPARGQYYVAEVERGGGPTVAGQLLVTSEWSDWRNGAFWWIQSVYVAEQFRGSGVFKMLYKHVHDLSRARSDVCGLRLYVDAHNSGAQAAYEKLGMRPTNYRFYELDFVL
jgi:GNAT superfamily N-acetyltransferase